MAQLRGFTRTKRSQLVFPIHIENFITSTTEQYRDVVAFFLNVIQKEQWVLNSDEWLKEIEKLTIQNKNNSQPKYNLKNSFGKFPSGFRRAAIAESFGESSSWRTRYKKWKENERYKQRKKK